MKISSALQVMVIVGPTLDAFSMIYCKNNPNLFFFSFFLLHTNSATWLMMGVGIPAALPAEGKKTSKYISMIEGRHGKIEGEHH